jgi:hypothetical protein
MQAQLGISYSNMSPLMPPILGLAITTSALCDDSSVAQAISLARETAGTYVPRRDEPIHSLFESTGASALLIVEQSRLLLLSADGVHYSYHPNMAAVRAQNIRHGKRDIFKDAADLRPGDAVLDCTLGFASEAAIASMLVGATGRVVGLESAAALAAVTRDGLRRFSVDLDVLNQAMQQIEVVTAEAGEYLSQLPDESFDVVCFDPFFKRRIAKSEHAVDPLFRFGDPRPLTSATVAQALRVARKRVLVKHPFRGAPTCLPQDVASQVVTSRRGPVAITVFDLQTARAAEQDRTASAGESPDPQFPE